MQKLKLITVISFFLLPLQSEEPIQPQEVNLNSPEGWGMSYMSAASLNLSDGLPATMDFGELVITAEVSNIPKLNREQQRIGFGGLKYEDLNKSPVFGRGKLKVGFYWDSILEVSFTPPLEIEGAKPKDLWGFALSKQLTSNDKFDLGLRFYSLSGKAVADVTCSKETVSQPLYTSGNPSGCVSVSKDKIDLGHKGFEIILASNETYLNFRPWVSIARSKIDSSVRIDAQLELSREIALVKTQGTLNTFSLGLNYPLSETLTLNLGTSYTPLDVNRPTPTGGTDSLWNIKFGLNWNPN